MCACHVKLDSTSSMRKSNLSCAPAQLRSFLRARATSSRFDCSPYCGREAMTFCGFVPPIRTVIPIPRHQIAPRRKRLRSAWLAPNPRQSLWRAQMAKNLESNEPVEDGVTLPKPLDQQELMRQSAWLQHELTNWLNSEWKQSEYQPVHDEIGKRTGMIYTRQRMEGEDDLSSVMLAIGSELEGMDFSQAFVGPWNVANRAAELLLEHCAGERVKWIPSFPADKSKVREESTSSPVSKATKRKRLASPSLADSFERMRFLQDILDGSAAKELIDGAVAVVMGYRYDANTGKWDGSEVEDGHFRSFEDQPPDILGDEDREDMTATLTYLGGFLQAAEDTSEGVSEGLDVVIETLHGTELTKVQMNDPHDHAFRKRVLVAKWLHLCGGF